MATGMSSYLANTFLNSFTTKYVQLHVGDPGISGTANTAVETTRKSATFATASGGTMSSSADVTWINIQGSQDATHFTIWDASTSGNFLLSGTIAGNAYTQGDNYTIPSGSLTVAFTVAS
jgi:hypothetical protein